MSGISSYARTFFKVPTVPERCTKKDPWKKQDRPGFFFPAFLNSLNPLPRLHHPGKPHLLRHEDRPVQLLIRHRPGRIRNGKRSRCIGQEVHRIAPVECLAGGSVASDICVM